MAKGAATEKALAGMHSLLARVLTKTLEKYEKSLDLLDKLDKDDLENEFIAAAIAEIGEPNPAMLSVIAKFLKDNEIAFDTEEVETLNSTERRLAERREARKRAGINLSVVPLHEAI